MHKKKDATDWGVEPQIIVPMDVNTEKVTRPGSRWTRT